MCICFVKEHSNLMNENSLLKSQLNDLSLNNEQLSEGNNKLQNEIDELNKQLEGDNMARPIWLTNDYPYKPFISIEEGKITLSDPRDIYAESITLTDIVKKWKNLPLNQRLQYIWYYVIDALTYAYDVNEDWQFSQVTINRQKGDCEDGTILFITLCKTAGIKSDSVFNACGWYTEGNNKYGHSFPIAKMEDGQWYIFESTLDFKPTNPKLFKGSNYDASWGLCNWKYYGKINGGDQI